MQSFKPSTQRLLIDLADTRLRNFRHERNARRVRHRIAADPVRLDLAKQMRAHVVAGERRIRPAHDDGLRALPHRSSLTPTTALSRTPGISLISPSTDDTHSPPDHLQQHGWLPIPRTRLPFPSIVAASTNDPLARFERVAALADAWGSRFIDIGAAGHLNPAAGYGDWPLAAELLADL